MQRPQACVLIVMVGRGSRRLASTSEGEALGESQRAHTSILDVQPLGQEKTHFWGLGAQPGTWLGWHVYKDR